MLRLKGCPRCGGDLYGDHDSYGRYLACIQCGHHLPDTPASPTPSPVRVLVDENWMGKAEPVAGRHKARLPGGSHHRAHKAAIAGEAFRQDR